MLNSELIIIIAFTIWNIIVFFLYGIDKYKAQKGQWRISESTLIITAFFMGGLGAFLGMKTFRHKTKHLKFKILVPLALIFNIALILGTIYLLYIRV
ncbi:MAG: DUF1294 domain-containing protein [Oscillospiraceae bacterium]